MWVVIESGGAWHIVILQPTGVELITVIISHSISGQKPSQSTWLDQILGSGRLRENYGEDWLLGLFLLHSSAFSGPLWFVFILKEWQVRFVLAHSLGELTKLLFNTTGSKMSSRHSSAAHCCNLFYILWRLKSLTFNLHVTNDSTIIIIPVFSML